MLGILVLGLLAIPIASTSTFLCKRSAAQRAIVKQSKPNVQLKKGVNPPQVPLRQEAPAPPQANEPKKKKEKPKKTIKSFFQKKKSVVPKKKTSRPTIPLKKTKSEAPLHTDVTQNSTRPLTHLISKPKTKRKRESPKTQQPPRQRAKQTSSRKSRRKKMLMNDPEVGGTVDLRSVDPFADFPRIQSRPESSQRSVRVEQTAQSIMNTPTLEPNQENPQSQSTSQKREESVKRAEADSSTKTDADN